MMIVYWGKKSDPGFFCPNRNASGKSQMNTTMSNPLSTTDDEYLLSAWTQRRDQTAFRALVEKYGGLVYGTVHRKSGRSDWAEDVVQEVFIVFARRAPQLKGTGELAGWLHQTALNKTLHRMRAESRHDTHMKKVAAHVSEAHVPAHSDEEWSAIRPVLDEAIASLDEQDRQVILCHYFQHKTFAEVAGITGLTHEAVRKRAQRVLVKLSDKLRRKTGRPVQATVAGILTSAGSQAAPAGLAAKTYMAALAAAGASTGAGTLGAISLFSIITMKTSTLTFLALSVAAAGGLTCGFWPRENQKPLKQTALVPASASVRFLSNAPPTGLSPHGSPVAGAAGNEVGKRSGISSGPRKPVPEHMRSYDEIMPLFEKYKDSIPEELHPAMGHLLMFRKNDPADPSFIEKCRKEMATWMASKIEPVTVDKDRLATFLERADKEIAGPMKGFAALKGVTSPGPPGREENYVDVSRQMKEGKLTADQITKLRQASPDDPLWKVYEARLAAKANDPTLALKLANEIVKGGQFADPALAMTRAAEWFVRTTEGISASEAYRRVQRSVPPAADSISELASDLTKAAQHETDPDAQFRIRAAAAGLINLNTEHDDPGVRMNAAMLEQEMVQSLTDEQLRLIYAMPPDQVRLSQKEQARAAADMKNLRDNIYKTSDAAEIAQYEAWRAEYGDYRALEMTAGRRADPLSLGGIPASR